MIIIISCPWTSVAVLTMQSSSLNLDSNLRLFSSCLYWISQVCHGSQASWPHPRHSLRRRHRFHFPRALHDASQHVRFHVLDDSSSSAVY